MAFWPRSYTQCVLFSKALGTTSLKFVVEAVYLGHIISPELKDDSDVYKHIKRLSTFVNVLIRHFASWQVFDRYMKDANYITLRRRSVWKVFWFEVWYKLVSVYMVRCFSYKLNLYRLRNVLTLHLRYIYRRITWFQWCWCFIST